MGGKVRLQPLLRADLQQQAGGEVIAVSVGIRAESRIDVDELPTHHRQPVGVGQGAFIGQQQAMVVLRQTRVIGEHARIRQFEMHPVEVHVRRDDVGARMLHIRRQECDLAGSICRVCSPTRIGRTPRRTNISSKVSMVRRRWRQPGPDTNCPTE